MRLDDFQVPGKDINVSGSMELRSEDIAGETNSTERAEKGIKPKVLRVSLIMPYKNLADLTRLIKVAEAVNDKGEQKIYTVTSRTATVAGIRQVRFYESVAWPEDGSRQVWNVSFALQEVMSNPERLEKRQNTVAPTIQKSEFSELLKKAEESLQHGQGL